MTNQILAITLRAIRGKRETMTDLWDPEMIEKVNGHVGIQLRPRGFQEIHTEVMLTVPV